MKLLLPLSRAVLSALLITQLGSAVYAQSNDVNKPLPSDPVVLKGKFENGLTYYVRPNHKPEKKVELRLVVNAGSILEDDEQQGLAHFMEHMNFNGTKHFEKNELVSYLQSIGVEFGADLNAYTSFDETVYILPVPTDKPGNLDKGFQIIEDWAQNALLTDKDIDEERAVVLEESRLGKGAEQRMLDKYLPELMSGSIYAKRLPIGKDEILKHFKYDRIRNFYKEWYRPELMAVVVVGDIDTATAMKYLRSHFATLKNKDGRKRMLPEVPTRNQPAAMVLTDKEATQYQLSILFPTMKQPAEKTVGDYRETIAEQLATQILNTRLSDLARGSNPPYLYAGTGMDGWARGYENFSAMAVFGDEGPQKALNALTAELLKAKQYGFTEAETELAKKNALAWMEKSYNERKNTESRNYAAEYIRNFLEQEPIPGMENEYGYYKAFLPGITVEELNGIIKKWMGSTNTFSLITAPENGKSKLPDDAALLAMTQKGFAQTVTPNEDKKVATELLAHKPAPGKITGKKEEAGLNATTYTLSNGVKVTIKKTEFKSDEILLSGVKKGGKNNYGLADMNNAKYAIAVVGAMGNGDFSPTDLEKVLAGKSVSANVAMDDIENRVSGSSNVKDIEAMFQLLYVRLMQPRKDEALFNAFKEKQKTAVQFAASNPQTAFIDTTMKTLYNNNPLRSYPIPKPEDYDAIDVNRAMQIYKDEFSHADGYHFFIVGNVDEKVVLPLLETYIGSIPAQGQEPKAKDNGVRPIKGVQTLKVYKGTEPKSMILGFYTGEVKYSEDLELKADALAEILNIKVIEELREKLGGIYSGGYFGNVSKEPYERYSLILQLPCGPENVDKLLAAAKAEIANLKEKGPDAKDLDKVKSQWHEQHREGIEKNGYWLAQLKEILYRNMSKENVLQYDAWIHKLTPADIQQTAKQLLNGKNEFTAILYPETEKK
jgi:zinc protease